MTEDALYRASSQYRLWSFTPESLASLRASTNAISAEGVRAAIRRAREARRKQHQLPSNSSPAAAGDGGGGAEEQGNGVKPELASNQVAYVEEKEIECLTVEEEQKLIGYYCVKAMGLADFCNLPTNVKATAIQYLKRFYLSNNPMTYHPKTIMPCALFLATKTESHYMALSAFAAKLDKTPEEVIAPEYLIAQGLRFTFDVRHPFRGLEGGFMELLALADVLEEEDRGGNEKQRQRRNGNANGAASASPRAEDKARSLGVNINVVRNVLGALPPLPLSAPAASTSISTSNPAPSKPSPLHHHQDLKTRIRTAHGQAKEILKTSAQLTDAYFLYTPAQIWLGALYAVDEALARAYIEVKFPTDVPPSSSPSSEQKHQRHRSLKPRLLLTLHELASLLSSSSSSSSSSSTGVGGGGGGGSSAAAAAAATTPSATELAELRKIDMKLFKCQNPERADIAAWNRAKKAGRSPAAGGAATVTATITAGNGAGAESDGNGGASEPKSGPSKDDATTAAATAAAAAAAAKPADSDRGVGITSNGGSASRDQDQDDSRAAKKRKVDRARLEADDVFGGPIGRG